MKLSYKDGKTIVEIEGQQISARKAISLFPNLEKVIINYSKNAKSLSQIKITFFKREITKPTYDGRWGDTVSFLINGKVIAQQNSDNAEKIITPDEYITPELKSKLDSIHDEIDWVNGTYLANKEIITKANYEFIQEYLNNAELDAKTGKVSTRVEPSFKRDDLNTSNYYPYGYIIGDNVKLVNDLYVDDYDRHGEKVIKINFEIVGKNVSYKTSSILDFVNGRTTNEEWENRANIAKFLKEANLDLVDAKVGAIKTYYCTDAKTKDFEIIEK